MMSEHDFKAWLNERWLKGKFTLNDVHIIKQHSIFNQKDYKSNYLKGTGKEGKR